MEDYERLVKIGEGASGVVYKARDRRTGETVAIKRLRAGGGNGAAFEAAFRREVRCLEACRGAHPSLVALRAAHLDPYTGEAFIVMDYAGRSLAEVLRDDGRAGKPFAEPEARRIMRALLEGAAAMHARGVLHRDIKPANVLLLDADARSGGGGVRICDLGLSRSTIADDTPPLTPGVATLWYRAPELMLGSEEYDAGVDTWALGCVMGELLTGGVPLFPGRSEMDTLNRVLDTLGAQDVASWRGFAALPRAGSPLCRRPRPPCSRLREVVPKLSDAGYRVLAGLLECRPDRRLTAADALRCPWFDDEDEGPAAAAADQPRASSSCSAGFSAAAGGVAVPGVAAEALVA